MINIKSKDMKNNISKLLKKEELQITEDDLMQIEKIALRKENIFCEKSDYVIQDLRELKNLKECSFFMFDFTENDLKIISEIRNLKSLKFSFCRFDLQQNQCQFDAEKMYFENCEGFELALISNKKLKKLTIIGNREEKIIIDVSEFNKCEFLEEVYIHNYDIKHIEKFIKSAPNLKVLNLDGSNVEENEIIENLNIKVSNKEFFLLTGL